MSTRGTQVPAEPASEADQRLEELSELLPGWHLWYVFTPLDPRGRYCYCGMPEGAGRSAVRSYDPAVLVASAQEFQLGLAGHIERTRRELAGTEDWNETRRRMLEADLAAFERLASA